MNELEGILMQSSFKHIDHALYNEHMSPSLLLALRLKNDKKPIITFHFEGEASLYDKCNEQDNIDDPKIRSL